MTWCRSVSMYLKGLRIQNRANDCPQNEERKGANEGRGGMGALEYEIDVFVVVRAQHVPQLDDVFMVVELLQEHAKCRQKTSRLKAWATHMISRKVLCASVAF